MFFCKNSFISEIFGISGFIGIIFRKFSGFTGIFPEIFPDLKVVLLPLEWHNLVSWKLKWPLPPPGSRWQHENS